MLVVEGVGVMTGVVLVTDDDVVVEMDVVVGVGEKVVDELVDVGVVEVVKELVVEGVEVVDVDKVEEVEGVLNVEDVVVGLVAEVMADVLLVVVVAAGDVCNGVVVGLAAGVVDVGADMAKT